MNGGFAHRVGDVSPVDPNSVRQSFYFIMLIINIVRDEGEFVIDRRPMTELFGELEASGA